MVKLKSPLLAVLLSAACAGAVQAQSATPAAPEIGTGYAEKAGWVARKYMVAAANPHAADAGAAILKQGGSALDAAIATQMVLTLVEPQSSGIGGGAFMVYFDGKQVLAYDGRETAPSKADERLFQRPDGTPLSRVEGIVGGRSVGAPGVLRMLELAHKKHGRLPWKALFAPAIRLAEQGFPVSARLNGMLTWDKHLRRDPVAASYFYDAAGQPWPVGHQLKNPALAATLKEIAAGGADAFYKGRIAREIAAKVRSHPTNPGLLTEQDIAAYAPRIRPSVCADYRAYTVCGMPPPSSGGIAVAQMLGILENVDMARYAPKDGVPGPDAVHLFAEAGRLAYADRDRYAADTDFVPLPGKGIPSLLDKGYLARRASLIGERSLGVAPPGNPFDTELAWGDNVSVETPSTSHIAIVDAQGHGLAMTTTVEDAFGSRQMVAGFMLNNQLTDFSFASRDEHGPVANRVQANKRPRSAMSPTIVFDKKTRKLVLTVGSPGGPAIINYVAKVLFGTLDWGMNMQQAISMPNFGSMNGPTLLETRRFPESTVQALQARGHRVQQYELTSGLQGIARMNIHGQEMWSGGADPRREGVARGE
ncbi:gamma-glutamyltransferase [Pseudoduganella sp. GCM10020061]|uniref:gamma-glutamyltransferase n=1 Tax=Pseudoduganella sp. GCM10020061 TaxID=3317345 RepID=UPI00363363BE